jgi:hypothetical protein
MQEDTSPNASEAANAFGAKRRPRRGVLIVVVLCIAPVQLLLIGLTNQTVRGWLHIGSSLPSCAAAGISTAAGREGKCARIDGLFSSRIYNVVDRGHTLHMPEYQARLLTSRITHTRVTGPSTNAAYYPDRHGLLVSYEITITNTRDTTLLFGQAASDTTLPFYPSHPQVELLMPPSLASSSGGSNEDIGLSEVINGRSASTRPSGCSNSYRPTAASRAERRSSLRAGRVNFSTCGQPTSTSIDSTTTITTPARSASGSNLGSAANLRARLWPRDVPPFARRTSSMSPKAHMT